MEGEAPKEAEIVFVYWILFVPLQPDDGFVIFHVVGQVDTDTADRVMYDAIYENVTLVTSSTTQSEFGRWAMAHCRTSVSSILSRNVLKVCKFVTNDASPKYRPQQLHEEW